MRQRAQKSAQRFTEEEFSVGWNDKIQELVAGPGPTVSRHPVGTSTASQLVFGLFVALILREIRAFLI